MPDPASAMILGFAYLSVKHTAGDFFLQTRYQYENKGIYGHPGGLLHALIHAGLTLPVLLILAPPSAGLALAIPAAEFVAHYHIDWVKERIVKGWGLTAEHSWYWRVLGVDQLLHALTYAAIVAVLAGVWP